MILNSYDAKPKGFFVNGDKCVLRLECERPSNILSHATEKFTVYADAWDELLVREIMNGKYRVIVELLEE